MKIFHPQLSHQVTPFIGRIKELEELTQSLQGSTCRLLTLTGPGGIGKTRLAIEAAERQFEEYEDGVYFVSLQALNTSDLIISTLANTLGFHILEDGNPRQQLLNYLSDKKLLLVMDSFEHLLDGAPLLSEILIYAPQVKLLVTSCTTLNLKEECIWQVNGLEVPEMTAPDTPVQCQNPLDYESVQLFVKTAERAYTDYSPDGDFSSIVEICHLVEGSPLGIELAAVWVRTLSCADIAQEIRHGLDILATRASNIEPRHQSIRATLDYAWNLLAETEQNTLIRLSVFRGGFTRDAATTITHTSLTEISALIDKSLLRHTQVNRYHLHELVQQYAEEHLNLQSTHSVQTHQQHCEYYMAFLDQRWNDLIGSNPTTALKEIDLELENIRAAWLWAVDHQRGDQIVKGAHSLGFFFDTRSRYREGERLFDRAASALMNAQDSPTQKLALGVVLLTQGILCMSLNDSVNENWLLRESHAILCAQDALCDAAFAQIRLSAFLHYRNQETEARQLLEQSIALFQEVGDQWGIAYAILTSLRSSDLSDQQRETYWSQAFTIFQSLDSHWGMAIALTFGSDLAIEREDFEEATKLALRGLSLCQEIGIRWAVLACLCSLGHAQTYLGNHQQALIYLIHAFRQAIETQLMRFIVGILQDVAQVLNTCEEDELSQKCYTMAYLHSTKLKQKHPNKNGSALLPEIYTMVDPHAPLPDLEAEDKALLKTLEGYLLVLTTSQSSTSIESPLTDRELEVLQLVALGATNREIAEELFVSVATVKWHLNVIYGKLQVKNRTQAIKQARLQHLLTD